MSNEVITVDEQRPVAVTTSPLAMVADAVQRGTDPATIKALMDLAERHEANEARKAYEVAINEFKANPPTIKKNKDVLHNGVFKYRHATLDNASTAIAAALHKVGISHRWDTEQTPDGKIKVTCVLTHIKGHSERTPLEAMPDSSGGKNSIQAVGSTVSYLQRYSLLAATGVSVADDTDDDGRQGKKISDENMAIYLGQIDRCKNEDDAKLIWAELAKVTTAAGDVESHETLRSAMAAKRKALKAKPAKVEDEGL